MAVVLPEFKVVATAVEFLMRGSQMLKLFYNLREMVEQYDFRVRDDRLAIASEAHALITAWFGEPVDSKTPSDIIVGPASGCGRDWWTGRYVLVIDRSIDTDEALCAAIAHEMYHRVTCKRCGLRERTWVDEMLAFLCEQHFLRSKGHDDYARIVVNAYKCQEDSAPMSTLGSVRRRSGIFSLGRKPYPPGFMSHVVQLGLAIERLAGWDNMRRIVKCTSWSEWMSPMSRDQRCEVKRLLGLTGSKEET